MSKKIMVLLLPLVLLASGAWGQETEQEEAKEKPLTGWFASGGFLAQCDGWWREGTFGAGLTAGIGKNLKGKPLALGLQLDYTLSGGWQKQDKDTYYDQTVGFRPFLRTYVFSRGPIGASFDVSVPIAVQMAGVGAESVSLGVSVSPSVVYFVNRRMTVFMTLSLFELSYNCTVALASYLPPTQHKFTAGFLNMGFSKALMGITWNL